MQVLYGEGVANHTGPESCAGGRETVREALTGVRAGQALSGVNSVRDADALEVAEGNTAVRVNASARPIPCRLGPWHVRPSSAREPGDPLPCPPGPSGGPHWEGASRSQ